MWLYYFSDIDRWKLEIIKSEEELRKGLIAVSA